MLQTVILILTLVNQLFPLVIQLVKTAEQAMPQSGQGAAKLEMVRTTLEGAFKTYTDAKVTFDQVWGVIQPLVNTYVKVQNATGGFSKGSAS